MSSIDCINCKNIHCLFKDCKSTKGLEKITLQSNEQVFLENLPVKGIYIVQQGAIEEFYLDANNDKVISHTAEDGEIFGHTDYSTTKYARNANTTEETQICFFSKSSIAKICLTDSNFSINLMIFFLEKLNNAENKRLKWTV